jgi:hypothetical protein
LVTDTHRFALKDSGTLGDSTGFLEPVSVDPRTQPARRHSSCGYGPRKGRQKEELATWLKRIEERSDGAVMIRQFRARSATAEGWGFDLVRAMDRTTRAGLRVILVPYPGGMAEFELRAPASEVADYYRVLRHLVASFSPRGWRNGSGNRRDRTR